MKKNLKKIILISLIVIAVVVTGVTQIIQNKLDSTKTEVVEKKTKKEKEVQEEQVTNNIIEEQPSEVNKPEVYTDQEMINYISDVESEVTKITEQKKVTETDKITLRNTFITLTDFIFYGGTIKGKTFDQLQDETKVKIIDLYNKIDSKIESVAPNYKENIKSTSKKVYTNVKEQASNLKEKIQNSYKEYAGEDAYNDTAKAFESDKQNVKDVYEVYEPAIEQAKEKAKDTYETAKDKVSNWYQDYKEGN